MARPCPPSSRKRRFACSTTRCCARTHATRAVRGAGGEISVHVAGGDAARGGQRGVWRLVAATQGGRCCGVHSAGGGRMSQLPPFSFSERPLDTAALQRALRDDTCGGFAAFEGWVRNHNEGHAVTRLEYEAFAELAEKEGARIVQAAIEKFGVQRAACVHRIGSLAIGEVAVWVGVSAAHRDEAFRACRFIIDEVKHRVPVWKKEHYVNGDSGWVNCERCAGAVPGTNSRNSQHASHAAHDHHACELRELVPGTAPDYSRQMALREVGTAGQERLRKASVLVVGAGGL